MAVGIERSEEAWGSGECSPTQPACRPRPQIWWHRASGRDLSGHVVQSGIDVVGQLLGVLSDPCGTIFGCGGGKKLVIFCTQGSLDCLGHSGKVGNGGVEKRVGEEDRKADNERGLIESFLPTEQTDSQASRGVRQPARSHE